VNKEKGLFVGLKTFPYLTTASTRNFQGSMATRSSGCVGKERGEGCQDCPLIKDEFQGDKTSYVKDAKSWEH
jgi:hypothetical protein